MTLPHRLERTPASTVPTDTEELGPDNPYAFAPLHRETAARCLEARGLLPPRLVLNHPGALVLGDPSLLMKRLSSSMPDGFHGSLGDYVPLGFTPKSASLYASMSFKPPQGTESVRAADVVTAAISLPRLIQSGIPVLFCDRSPHHRRVVMSKDVRLNDVPWDLLRKAQFAGRDVDPDRLSRYHAEILIYGLVPLELVQFAVKDEDALVAMRKRASELGVDDVGIVVRPDFFRFGRR